MSHDLSKLKAEGQPSHMDEEVFLDAEEDITPRRTGRKRRSTAGSTTAVKKPKTKMTTKHSPKAASTVPASAGASRAHRSAGSPAGADKSGPPADHEAFWTKMGGMLRGLETRMKRETDQMKGQLEAAVGAIGDLGTRVEKAEKRLHGLEDEVNSLVEKKLAARPNLPGVTAESGRAGTGNHPPTSPASSYASALMSGLSKGGGDRPLGGWKTARSPKGKREDNYWECRRALRLRPVGPGDPEQAVLSFMTDHLLLGSSFIESVGSFTVRRVPSGPSARVRDEVIVKFQTIDIRDAVKGAARNLAGKGPDYGVRLELPDHLKSSMKSIQAVSYDIKKRYPQARRNVLFDDETQELVLDFCTREGEAWRRLTSAQAKERKKKMPGPESKMPMQDGEIDSLLDKPVCEEEDGVCEEGGELEDQE